MGIPQVPIFGPLLSNMYMWDLFLCDCESNIINYKDDTVLHACEPNMDLVLSKIENKTPLTPLRSFNKLTFENYLLNIVQKDNQKI